MLDREARELRIKNRTLAQQQAREAEERDAEAKLAAQEIARKDEEAKQVSVCLGLCWVKIIIFLFCCELLAQFEFGSAPSINAQANSWK